MGMGMRGGVMGGGGGMMRGGMPAMMGMPAMPTMGMGMGMGMGAMGTGFVGGNVNGGFGGRGGMMPQRGGMSGGFGGRGMMGGGMGKISCNFLCTVHIFINCSRRNGRNANGCQGRLQRSARAL